MASSSSMSVGTPIALATPQSKVAVATFNIGAADESAHTSSKAEPIFKAKLEKDVRHIADACDVICFQEVNDKWASVIKDVLTAGGRCLLAGRDR